MKTGYAFADHIKTEKIGRRHQFDDTGKPHRLRTFFLPFFLLVVFGILFLRLILLQVFQGSSYRALADSNRIRTKIIHAPRGIIFDRHGVPLVLNVPGFRLIEKDKSRPVSKEKALTLLAKGDNRIEVASLRQYPFNDVFSHVLGYTGQITGKQLSEEMYASYQPSDWVGKFGLEEYYESILRGTDGKQLLEVDAMGKPTRTLGQTDPIPGRDIAVTLDSNIQQAAYDATRHVKHGAVIVTTPDGQVLALLSRPSFDPNLFTLDETYKTTDSAYPNVEAVLVDNTSQPLLNRAISGVYPPGSTFKLVTAAAGLEKRIFDENYRVVDTGVLKVGEFSYANWYFTNYGKKEPGELDVVRALARSNDIFFYKASEKIKQEPLSDTARAFGLGNRLGIDLSSEAEGLVPSQEWKKKTYGESWYLGDTFHFGIGQGFLLTTPLQVNAFTQVVANGGTLYQPRLLKNQESRIKKKDFLSDKTISLIRKGMIDSCSPRGVAWPLFKLKIRNEKLKIDGKNFLAPLEASTSASMKEYREVVVACKTGTAQHGGEETMPHAWITLFAPAYSPEIVLTVLNESAGEGSNEAAPIAKKILEAYFSK